VDDGDGGPRVDSDTKAGDEETGTEGAKLDSDIEGDDIPWVEKRWEEVVGEDGFGSSRGKRFGVPTVRPLFCKARSRSAMEPPDL
jgi:hypothetical protein